MSYFSATGPPARMDVRPYAAPPPVSNRFAVMLALTPLLWPVLDVVFGVAPMSRATYQPVMLVVIFLISSALVAADARLLCRAGITLGSIAWMAILVPLHLLLRSARSKQAFGLVVVWAIALGVSSPGVNLLNRTIGVRIDGAKAARFLQAKLVGQSNFAGVQVDSPAYPRVRVGNTFRCSLTNTPVPVQAEVEVINLKGKFTWDVAPNV